MCRPPDVQLPPQPELAVRTQQSPRQANESTSTGFRIRLRDDLTPEQQADVAYMHEVMRGMPYVPFWLTYDRAWALPTGVERWSPVAILRMKLLLARHMAEWNRAVAAREWQVSMHCIPQRCPALTRSSLSSLLRPLPLVSQTLPQAYLGHVGGPMEGYPPSSVSRLHRRLELIWFAVTGHFLDYRWVSPTARHALSSTWAQPPTPCL
jgi:hypothetical protein